MPENSPNNEPVDAGSISSVKDPKSPKKGTRKPRKSRRLRFSKQTRRITLLLAIISLLLFVIIFLLGYVWFPKHMDIKIKETREKIETMGNSTVIKFTFFSIVNPEEAKRGAKIRVRELGPYIYNYVTELNGTIATTRYVFDSEASSPFTENESLVVVNKWFVDIARTIVYKYYEDWDMKKLNSMLNKAFDSAANIFYTDSVEGILFRGLEFCKPIDPHDEYYFKFCNLVYKMYIQETLEYDPGVLLYNLKHYTKVEQHDVNEKIRTPKVWRRNEYKCNEIRGVSPGDNFPPHVKSNLNYELYFESICRKVKVGYNTTEYIGNVPGYKFTALENSFHGSLPENRCYCIPNVVNKKYTNQMGCLEDGAIDMTTCAGTLDLKSFPHFMYADQTYHKHIDGLKPDQSDHESFVIVEPTSGVVLRLVQRYQTAVILEPLASIDQMRSSAFGYVPLMWQEVEFKQSDAAIEELRKQVTSKVSTMEYVKAIFGVISLVAFIVLLTLALR